MFYLTKKDALRRLSQQKYSAQIMNSDKHLLLIIISEQWSHTTTTAELFLHTAQ